MIEEQEDAPEHGHGGSDGGGGDESDVSKRAETLSITFSLEDETRVTKKADNTVRVTTHARTTKRTRQVCRY